MVSLILNDMPQNELGMNYKSDMSNIVNSVHSLTLLKEFQSPSRKKKCKSVKSLDYAKHIIEAMSPSEEIHPCLRGSL